MPSGLDGNPEPLTSPAREAVLAALAGEIERRRTSGVLRVAVDGVDGAGKSTFADELARLLERRGVPVIRSTTDSFHRPRAERWRRGRLSGEGFYRDSHDLDLLRELLLDPLSASPLRPHRVAAFDELADRPVEAPLERARPGSVLLFDGLFLQRPELRHHWDFVVYLDGETRVRRLRVDRACRDCPPGAEGFLHLAAFWAVLGRYVGGFGRYVEECAPRSAADAVVDNNDWLAPTLTIRGR